MEHKQRMQAHDSLLLVLHISQGIDTDQDICDVHVYVAFDGSW